MSKTEDYLEIRKLTAQYNQTFDSGNLDGWMDCFTDDIIFILDGKELGNGLAAMRKFGASMQAKLQVRHITTDAIVEINGDTATQDVYLLLIDTSNGSEFKTSGCYSDQLRRVNGRWKFNHRIATLDGSLD